ncbi:hypothetical protein F4803DRAFT_490369 [Xylaria telfairii]|nr:hypothetical protein F4803DRAFT_490369 [Xylaria telfairii]
MLWLVIAENGSRSVLITYAMVSKFRSPRLVLFPSVLCCLVLSGLVWSGLVGRQPSYFHSSLSIAALIVLRWAPAVSGSLCMQQKHCRSSSCSLAFANDTQTKLTTTRATTDINSRSVLVYYQYLISWP